MASRFDIYVATLLKTQRWLTRYMFDLQYEKEFNDNRKLSSCVVVTSSSPQMMVVAGLERGNNTSYISYIFHIITWQIFCYNNKRTYGYRGFCTCSSSKESLVKKQLRELHPSEKKVLQSENLCRAGKTPGPLQCAFVWNEALTWSTSRKINDWKMKIITLINSLAIKLLFFIDLRYPK